MLLDVDLGWNTGALDTSGFLGALGSGLEGFGGGWEAGSQKKQTRAKADFDTALALRDRTGALDSLQRMHEGNPIANQFGEWMGAKKAKYEAPKNALNAYFDRLDQSDAIERATAIAALRKAGYKFKPTPAGGTSAAPLATPPKPGSYPKTGEAEPGYLPFVPTPPQPSLGTPVRGVQEGRLSATGAETAPGTNPWEAFTSALLGDMKPPPPSGQLKPDRDQSAVTFPLLERGLPAISRQRPAGQLGPFSIPMGGASLPVGGVGGRSLGDVPLHDLPGRAPTPYSEDPAIFGNVLSAPGDVGEISGYPSNVIPPPPQAPPAPDAARDQDYPHTTKGFTPNDITPEERSRLRRALGLDGAEVLGPPAPGSAGPISRMPRVPLTAEQEAVIFSGLDDEHALPQETTTRGAMEQQAMPPIPPSVVPSAVVAQSPPELPPVGRQDTFATEAEATPPPPQATGAFEYEIPGLGTFEEEPPPAWLKDHAEGVAKAAGLSIDLSRMTEEDLRDFITIVKSKQETPHYEKIPDPRKPGNVIYSKIEPGQSFDPGATEKPNYFDQDVTDKGKPYVERVFYRFDQNGKVVPTDRVRLKPDDAKKTWHERPRVTVDPKTGKKYEETVYWTEDPAKPVYVSRDKEITKDAKERTKGYKTIRDASGRPVQRYVYEDTDMPAPGPDGKPVPDVPIEESPEAKLARVMINRLRIQANLAPRGLYPGSPGYAEAEAKILAENGIEQPQSPEDKALQERIDRYLRERGGAK